MFCSADASKPGGAGKDVLELLAIAQTAPAAKHGLGLLQAKVGEEWSEGQSHDFSTECRILGSLGSDEHMCHALLAEHGRSESTAAARPHLLSPERLSDQSSDAN